MSETPQWWRKPRPVAVVVDNDGWMRPHGERLAERLRAAGDEAAFHPRAEAVPEGTAVAFYLGCLRIVPRAVLERSRRNLVVHASDLPAGRGMSPLTWQVLEGRDRIPVCLLEAEAEVDSGAVVYREHLDFAGHELIDEMREALAAHTVELCERFLAEPAPPAGEPQRGEPSYYPRRTPEDSALDPRRSIAEQFDLLRVVDNERYPAFFDWRGHRYRLRIEKADDPDDTP